MGRGPVEVFPPLSLFTFRTKSIEPKARPPISTLPGSRKPLAFDSGFPEQYRRKLSGPSPRVVGRLLSPNNGYGAVDRWKSCCLSHTTKRDASPHTQLTIHHHHHHPPRNRCKALAQVEFTRPSPSSPQQQSAAASKMSDTSTPAAAAPAPATTLEERSFITVVLDQASLETVKMKSGQYCLLNCDDHQVRVHGGWPAAPWRTARSIEQLTD
jgi:hypothetical protein